MIRRSELFMVAFLLPGLPGPPGSHAGISATALPAFLEPDANPDGDSLTTEEERQYGTDPFNPDTDGDGVPE